VIGDFEKIFKDEKAAVLQAVDDFKKEIIDKYKSLSITEMLKKFVAILGDLLLKSAENVVLASIDIIQLIATSMVYVFEYEVHIPILSWLYKQISGGEELSLIDLVCLIAAIPFNIIYRLANHNNVPYPDDKHTSDLINAPTFDELMKILNPHSKPLQLRSFRNISKSFSSSETTTLDATTDERLSKFQYTCNYLGLIGAIGLSICNVLKAIPKFEDNPAVFVIGAIFYMPYVAPNWPGFGNTDVFLNTLITSICMVKALADICLFSKKTNPIAKFWDGWSPALDCFYNALWEVPVVEAFLSDSTKSRNYTIAGNTFFNFGGVITPGANYPKDEEVKIGFCAAIQVCNVVYGFMMFTDNIIEGVNPDLEM